MDRVFFRVLLMLIVCSISDTSIYASVSAPVEDGDGAATETPDSPWLFTPLISSAPKFGTSIGAMGAYLHKFDESSPTSMFAAIVSYSNTESLVYGGFGATYFDNDNQRLMLGAIRTEINNEYSDFLGTGLPVLTTDDVHAIFVRYLYRFKGNWFFGPQGLSTDYAISGNDWFSQEVLARIGLTGFSSNGLGLVIERDTRDNLNSPSDGSRFNINNVAYRESLGGDNSFDAFALSFTKYISHGNRHVLAGRINGRWTHGAPVGGYSSVSLRGYTMGQYLAPHSTLIEIEERFHIKNRWGATAFTGVACLYGDDRDCFDGDNLYPAIGVGLTFMLKLEEKMIARTEIAKGEGDNFGFYIKFGYEF